MKKQPIKPTRSKFNSLGQVCNLIPQHLVSKIARVTGLEDKSRTFKPWSHVVTQFVQIVFVFWLLASDYCPLPIGFKYLQNNLRLSYVNSALFNGEANRLTQKTNRTII